MEWGGGNTPNPPVVSDAFPAPEWLTAAKRAYSRQRLSRDWGPNQLSKRCSRDWGGELGVSGMPN